MSDISRTTTGAPPQQTQEQQKQSSSQEQPQLASQQRFEKKLKEERDKKSSDKDKSKSQDLNEAMRQAKRGAQKPPSQTLAARDKGGKPNNNPLENPKENLRDNPKDNLKNNLKDNLRNNPKDNYLTRRSQSLGGSSAEHLLERQSKTPKDKADAILQGLQPQALAASHTIAEAQQTSAPGQTSALFEEFQAVADRVMHTNQSLQQGGSVRVLLSSGVLPGTSVTFKMVAGKLHVSFSGNNKKSLDKVRENKEGLVSHVRQQSGVDIVVSTEDEQGEEQEGAL